jgi:putative transposase
VYLAIGASPEGRKDVLRIWIEQIEGAKFWLRVMPEIKKRRGKRYSDRRHQWIGFPEAINSVFPETQIQTCIVHWIPNFLDFCSWKDAKPSIAAGAEAAAAALRDFEDRAKGRRFSAITALWRRHWAHVVPLLRVSPGGSQNDLHDQCH